jgi:hypothetical protein
MISGRGIAPTRCRATTDGASATSTSPARVVTNWVSPGRCRGTKPKTRERLRSASGQKRLTMTEVSSIVEVVSKRVPWNKGKIVGAKPPLLKHRVDGRNWTWPDAPFLGADFRTRSFVTEMGISRHVRFSQRPLSGHRGMSQEVPRGDIGWPAGLLACG